MQSTKAAKESCTRFISYRYPKSARQELLELANYIGDDTPPDESGTGELVEGLESRVAELLGKPAALFMPSGTAAQSIALRLWCERSGSKTIAVHPRSHIIENEAQTYQLLHGLNSIPLGQPNQQATLSDVAALGEPVGVATVELPLRNLGWPLPDWDTLTTMSKTLRDRGIPFHADAARIWELQPYYDKRISEIADLFDSLYVSFYKGLGAPAGAAIAGPVDLLEEARVWQKRTGARLSKVYPYVIGALQGLDEKLPLMPTYYRKAQAIADALRPLPGVRINPDPPMSNSFQIVLDGDAAKLEAAGIRVAEETSIWPFGRIVPSPIQGIAIFEAVILDAALDLSEAEIVDCIARVAAYINDDT